MDNIKQKKPRRWLKIASYVGLGLLALETALLVGSCVVSCSNKGQETQASDGVRITSPVAKPFLANPSPESGFPNLLESIPSSDVYNYVCIEYGSNTSNTLLYHDNNYESRLIVLPAGRYFIGADEDHTYGWSKYVSFAPDRIAFYGLRESMRSISNGGANVTLPNTNWSIQYVATPSGVSSRFVTLTSSTAFLFACRSIDMPYVYLVDGDADLSDVTINLPSNYDFRRWVANVDPATGCLSMETRDGNGVGFRNFVFPYVWRAGDGNVYNYIYLNVIGLDASNALIVNGNGDAKLASDTFGSNYTKFSMLMNVRYGFDPNYTGDYIETYNQQVSLNPLYTAIVYRNTLVSGNLDGGGVSAFDCRAVYLDPFYRYFDVFQDWGVVFSTPAYSNITTGQLLGMDLYTITILGDVSTSPMSMLTQGFNAIASILTIQILPNVTLGLLMFIPLVVTIILVIVRLLQK